MSEKGEKIAETSNFTFYNVGSQSLFGVLPKRKNEQAFVCSVDTENGTYGDCFGGNPAHHASAFAEYIDRNIKEMVNTQKKPRTESDVI